MLSFSTPTRLPSHPIAHNATRTKNHSINGVLDPMEGGGLYDIMT
ncbi:hypothetical protein CORMATOL_00115 [Corynebacterium matruchotii ATCC 33806]|uniref:Uncharacterized protein n=1 Tax=Corynebacterium matruchotii ATCC 33806 TaxID=566549 RepID=C0DZH6_9CORY|nr:hypothetical protein CORMATOL_00115 [Corynebacterium matruchotii ATCC 33806]